MSRTDDEDDYEVRKVYEGPKLSESKNIPYHAEDLFKLSRDLKAAAGTMNVQEARYLVDLYYMMQENRKRAANQVRAMKGEPHVTLEWFADKAKRMENELRRSLESFAQAQEVGEYMLSVHGIGPVIAAGLISHISIEKAPTAGHIWRFAGLDPTIVWGKGQKRPHNARLKTLCWKIGQSFMKNAGREDCYYGHLYKERKAFEIARNDRGDMIETAKAILEKRNFNKATEAYKHLTGTAKRKDSELEEGMQNYPEFPHLPPAQIDARARRWAVKIFLSHVQIIWYWLFYHRLPPVPYPLATTASGQVHSKLIVPPYWSEMTEMMTHMRRGLWLPHVPEVPKSTPRLPRQSA